MSLLIFVGIYIIDIFKSLGRAGNAHGVPIKFILLLSLKKIPFNYFCYRQIITLHPTGLPRSIKLHYYDTGKTSRVRCSLSKLDKLSIQSLYEVTLVVNTMINIYSYPLFG